MSRRLPTSGMGLFSVIWLGQFISFIGSAMTGFALGVKVFQDTGSVTRFALIGLSSAIATLVVSPFAGVVADRFDRRLVLIGAQLGSVLSNSILLWLIVNDRLTPNHIYPLVAVGAVFGSFLWPTLGAAVTTIVGKADFARASGMLQMGASLSSISGPLFAGLLLEPIGLAGIVRLNIISVLIAMALMVCVRIPRVTQRANAPAQPAVGAPSDTPEATSPSDAPSTAAPTTNSAASGWHFVRSRPGLMRLLLTFAFLNFAVGMVQVLITPLVLSFSTPRVLGLVASIASSGALVGGTVMSVWGGPRRRVPIIFAVASLQGILLFIGGTQANPTLIAVAAFFFLLGFPITIGASQAIWQSKTPPEIQGRVFAVRRMVAGSSVPFAQAVAGPLADHVFEPMMDIGGAWTGVLGPFLGTGPGRGIGLMYVILGLGLAISAFVLGRSRVLRRLETDLPDAVTDESGSPMPQRTVSKATTALPLRLAVGLLALITVLGVVAADRGMRAPAAVGADAPPDQFSAVRAMRHTAAISNEPHPVASPAQAAAANYLASELEKLGFEVDRQRIDYKQTGYLIASVTTLENIVARWPGTGGNARRTILLAAHYDSIPSGPGASDNGAAVGALIETARALSVGPSLPNDIVLLFTDGEEAGLLGANAFVRHHPWADDVAVVVNVDARGNRGAAFVFETGDENGWWIPRLAQAVPSAAASSVMSAIYNRLPNLTDFNVFRLAQWAGFNIAPVGGLVHYHSERDRVEFLDPRTVQHQGTYTLALARAAGVLDLSAPPESRLKPDRAFFSVLGLRLVHYGAWLAWLSAALGIIGFIALIVTGLRSRALTTFGLAQGFLAGFAILISVPVAVTLIWMVVRDAGRIPVIMGSTAAAPLFMIAFAALSIGAVALLQRFFRMSVGVLDLLVGSLGWWLVVVIVTTNTVLPVVSNFLVVWPFLAAVLGAFYLVRTPPSEWSNLRTTVVLALSAIPALVLVPPFVSSAYVTLQSLFQLGGASLLPLIFLLLLLTPHIEAAGAGRRWLIPGLSLVIGVLALGMAMVRSSTVEQFTMSSVLYLWDIERDQRSWISYDTETTAWSRQFGFEDEVKTDGLKRIFPLVGPNLAADAPDVPLERPTVTLLDTDTRDGIRRYGFEIAAPPDSTARLLTFEPLESVISVRINGQTLSTAPPTVMVTRIPVNPIETMEIRVRGDDPVKMIINEQSPGLPAAANAPERSALDLTRPFLSMVRSDVTFVRNVIELSPAAYDSARVETTEADENAPATQPASEPITTTTPGAD